MKHKLKLAFILGVEFIALAAVLVLIFLAGKKQYTVTFDLNGGELLSGSIEQSVTQGSNATPPSVYKEGHYLRGWSGNYTKVTQDVKVTAIWEYETTPGIEYYKPGGATYTTISGCFKAISGKVYIGAYHDNLIVFSILDSAFEDCSKISEIYLLDGILTIGNRAFANCSSLEAIELPNTVTSIGSEAFENCAKLKKIVLPESLEVLGERAFAGCESLEEVYIPSTVQYISESAFAGCEKLKKIVFVDYADENEDEYENDSDKESASEHEDDEEQEDVKKPELIIGSYSFSGCSSLEEIILPEGVSYIGNGAFSGCSSLAYIVIPKSVEFMGEGVFDTDIAIYTYMEEGDEFPEGFASGWYTGDSTLVYGYNGEDITIETDEEEAE